MNKQTLFCAFTLIAGLAFATDSVQDDDVDTTGNITIDVPSGDTLTINGKVTGSGTITKIKKGQGFLFELAEDAARKGLHRVTGLFGERPREAHGFEFETGDEVAEDGYFAVRAYGVTGTVEMDGLAVMELPGKEKEK